MAKNLNTTNKKPISPTLNLLEPGQKATFGYKQYSSVTSAITRIHTLTDKHFTTKKNAETKVVTVIREA